MHSFVKRLVIAGGDRNIYLRAPLSLAQNKFLKVGNTYGNFVVVSSCSFCDEAAPNKPLAWTASLLIAYVRA
ncbi:hypothetical protein HZS61_003154 [Fusarium oxysporum f. sp. conglutinans]|uniref:Uncharacterized protein n=1 Tax=Fusarium oxysporum f. sp. conglutinans TaxID=100902 RepID=A0A8H6LFR2_FUSOX|nr:hypothetical protein HZS61_003154 [Fusarium oxysporum f. sp. conglutinans]